MKSTYSLILLIYLLSSSGCTESKHLRPPSYSLLWEINGNGLKAPSYLFGVIHLDGKHFVDSLTTLTAKFNTCKAVLSEVVLDSSFLKKSVSVARLTNNTLDKIFTPEEYDSIATEIRLRTMADLKNFNGFKPLIVETYLASCLNPKSSITKRKPTLGQYLQYIGKNRGDKIIGLETFEEEMDISFNMPIAEQKRHLLFVVKEINAAKKNLDLMYQLYDEQDVENLYEIPMKTDKEYTLAEKNAIIKDRNIKWMDKIPAIISEQPTFIAVEVFHLGGNDGLINLLRKKGYTVKPVNI